MDHDIAIRGHLYGLRPAAAADASFIVALRTASGGFLNRGASTIAEQLAWFDAYFARPDDYFFVIDRNDDGALEGLAGIYHVERDRASAEWGRFVVRSGSKAAVEGALLVFRCAFERLKLGSVRCRTLTANARALAFQDSCGLTRTPAPVQIEVDGTPRDAVEHILTRERWPAVGAHLDRVARRIARPRPPSGIIRASMLIGTGDLEFHHIGVACADIEAEAARLAPLGYRAEGGPFVDERQGIRGMFLAGQTPRLELLEPLADAGDSVLASYLSREIKLYHLAYLARDLAAAIDDLRREGAKLVMAPVPAVAFGGREIAFVMLPNLMLVELVATLP